MMALRIAGFAASAVFLHVSAVSSVSASELRVVGAPETVYSWERQRCREDWIPDSPARAIRLRDGSIALWATHYSNGVLRGQDFSTLTPDCTVRAAGAENPDPAAYDDRFWIQALVPVEDGQLIAFASHEYMGSRHPGKCRTQPERGQACWYSSIVLAEAGEDNLAFRLLDLRRRVVATSHRPYSDALKERTGFFTSSNVVFKDGYYYFMSWREQSGVKGHCLFRSASPSAGWYAWRAGSFDVSYTAPVEGPSPDCDIVGKGRLPNIVRSLVWQEQGRSWLGAFIMPPGNPLPEGVYTSVSQDLINWSAPQLLLSTTSEANTAGCKEVFQYPSIIDHRSRSREFSTISDRAFLYLTRFNMSACQRGYDRDLIRIPLRASD